MKQKILISTGGTGGHVIPAIIMHEHLSQENNVLIFMTIHIAYATSLVFRMESGQT